MSLINEALKKAQRQRSLDAAPLSSAPSGVAAAAVTTHVRAASHRRSYAPVWFGLGLLVLGVGATVVIMRYGIDSGPAPVAVVATPVVAAPPPAPVSSTTEAAVVLPPIASAPAAVASTPPPLAPTTTAPEPAPTPATAPLAFVPTPSPVVAAPPATAPATSAPEAAPVAVQPVNIAALGDSERAALVYSFLDTARLTGVRGTGTSARVLMNERVYRLNDIVDVALGLRLSAVRPNLMVFTDAQGKTYEKPY